MEEKKEIKIKFSTFILLLIIFILLIALGVMYYIDFVKNKSTVDAGNNNTISNNVEATNENKTENQVVDQKNADGFLTEEEINQILGQDDTSFIIDSINEDGNDYIVTAYLLEKDPKIVTQKEYDNLLNGGKIQFRNHDYVLDNTPNLLDETYIKSGEKKLSLTNNEGKYLISNSAGAVAFLSDTAGNKIKFKVDSNLIFINSYSEFFGDSEKSYVHDSNGKLKVLYTNIDTNEKEYVDSKTSKSNSIDGLIEQLSDPHISGSYEEYNAYVEDGKVLVIISNYK